MSSTRNPDHANPISIPSAVPAWAIAAALTLVLLASPRPASAQCGEPPASAAADTAPTDTAGVADERTITRQPQMLNRSTVIRLLSQSYPEAMRMRGIEGRVMLKMVVEPTGRVRRGSLRVISFDDREFEDAAIHVAQGMCFRPARAGDRPVAAWVQLPVDFHLQRGPAHASGVRP